MVKDDTASFSKVERETAPLNQRRDSFLHRRRSRFDLSLHVKRWPSVAAMLCKQLLKLFTFLQQLVNDHKRMLTTPIEVQPTTGPGKVTVDCQSSHD
jgi:hypothetical protein